MTTRSLEDIYKYEKDAIEAIAHDHPYHDEIIDLLNEQIQDEVWCHANTRTN